MRRSSGSDSDEINEKADRLIEKGDAAARKLKSAAKKSSARKILDPDPEKRREEITAAMGKDGDRSESLKKVWRDLSEDSHDLVIKMLDEGDAGKPGANRKVGPSEPNSDERKGEELENISACMVVELIGPVKDKCKNMPVFDLKSMQRAHPADNFCIDEKGNPFGLDHFLPPDLDTHGKPSEWKTVAKMDCVNTYYNHCHNKKAQQDQSNKFVGLIPVIGIFDITEIEDEDRIAVLDLFNEEGLLQLRAEIEDDIEEAKARSVREAHEKGSGAKKYAEKNWSADNAPTENDLQKAYDKASKIVKDRLDIVIMDMGRELDKIDALMPKNSGAGNCIIIDRSKEGAEQIVSASYTLPIEPTIANEEDSSSEDSIDLFG